MSGDEVDQDPSNDEQRWREKDPWLELGEKLRRGEFQGNMTDEGWKITGGEPGELIELSNRMRAWIGLPPQAD